MSLGLPGSIPSGTQLFLTANFYVRFWRMGEGGERGARVLTCPCFFWGGAVDVRPRPCARVRVDVSVLFNLWLAAAFLRSCLRVRAF